ncbi:UPF0041 family protein [Cavenderia fasciculata]|uniref:Mitochondrial pyruvate carrier n=1 Tax=Cavenderia fasciculata TaxID=261658 RepID=F4Q465_CACFS|nr:UPF0041 family protein [Cavenderia fasciculata]EGG17767.1 UPF0041 family protein [Cavenderia fasciculata]|eukprot:XP_004356251.1 UPF0041 family protein [Cavenderia fasciculata]
MSEKWTKFVGFLGAAANWTIPIASIMNLKNDPSTIDPVMTTTLASYSMVFTRWSIAISPPNYWLLACHVTNSIAQATQLGRWGWYKTQGEKPTTTTITSSIPEAVQNK